MLLLVALAVVAVTAARASPSIEAVGNDILISVGDGSNVSIATFDPRSGRTLGPAAAVVTTISIGPLLEQARGETLDLASQQVFEALSDIRTEMADMHSGNRTTFITDELASLRAGLNNLQGTELDALQTRLTRLEAAMFPADALACAPYPTLRSGTAHGTGTAPGSIRVLACNAGFRLTGSTVETMAGTVVCNGNGNSTGTWSDGRSSRCVSATQPPTVSPTARPETVTCCLNGDNFIFEVWADGRRLNMFGPPPRHNTVTTVQFASTARVLGVWAADGEAGCDMGHFIARCSTESGNSKWDLGSNSHDGWQVRTTWDNDGGASVRQFGTAWLQPGYINSAFVNASEQTDRGNSLRDIASAMMARGPDVCRLNELGGVTMQPICGGGFNAWDSSNNRRTDWLFRIEPQP